MLHKSCLSLVKALKSMKPQHRVVILSHLDERARDQLCECIHELLFSSRISSRKRLLLRLKLMDHNHNLRTVCGPPGKRTASKKKKNLVQMGGAPMSILLKSAIPYLMDIFK